VTRCAAVTSLPSPQPENLLLKEDSYSSEIKIADFGLSQLVRPTGRTAGSGVPL